MKNLKGMLVVGGLVAALSGCRREPSLAEVKGLALSKGWNDVTAELVQEDSYVCGGQVNLYSVEGINPQGKQAIGYVCCGVWDPVFGDSVCKFTGGN